MKKYWHVINIGIQNNLTYRFNFLARAQFGLVPLIAILYVWRTIFEGKGEGGLVGAYTLAEMISYYLLVTVVDALSAVNEDVETNNCTPSAGQVWVKKPDLVATAVSNPPAEGFIGSSFAVTDTTENRGLAAAGASTTRSRLSPDATVTSPDPLLTGSRGRQ